MTDSEINAHNFHHNHTVQASSVLKETDTDKDAADSLTLTIPIKLIVDHLNNAEEKILTNNPKNLVQHSETFSHLFKYANDPNTEHHITICFLSFGQQLSQD